MQKDNKCQADINDSGIEGCFQASELIMQRAKDIVSPRHSLPTVLKEAISHKDMEEKVPRERYQEELQTLVNEGVRSEKEVIEQLHQRQTNKLKKYLNAVEQ